MVWSVLISIIHRHTVTAPDIFTSSSCVLVLLLLLHLFQSPGVVRMVWDFYLPHCPVHLTPDFPYKRLGVIPAGYRAVSRTCPISALLFISA